MISPPNARPADRAGAAIIPTQASGAPGFLQAAGFDTATAALSVATFGFALLWMVVTLSQVLAPEFGGLDYYGIGLVSRGPGE